MPLTPPRRTSGAAAHRRSPRSCTLLHQVQGECTLHSSWLIHHVACTVEMWVGGRSHRRATQGVRGGTPPPTMKPQHRPPTHAASADAFKYKESTTDGARGMVHGNAAAAAGQLRIPAGRRGCLVSGRGQAGLSEEGARPHTWRGFGRRAPASAAQCNISGRSAAQRADRGRARWAGVAAVPHRGQLHPSIKQPPPPRPQQQAAVVHSRPSSTQPGRTWNASFACGCRHLSGCSATAISLQQERHTQGAQADEMISTQCIR